MNNHKFSKGKKDPLTNKLYKKCELCGRVMFEDGDEAFNMNCSVAAENTEHIRQRLEKDKKL